MPTSQHATGVITKAVVGRKVNRGLAETAVGVSNRSSESIGFTSTPRAVEQFQYTISIEGLRFIAQNIMTRRFLHWDLPINNPTITWSLSGPFHLSGSINPPVIDVVDLGLDEWATFIHVEYLGVVLGTGILQAVNYSADEMTIEAVGISSYPQGIPYIDNFSQFFPDIMTVIREMWRHIQSFPNGNMGILLPGGYMGVPLYGKQVNDETTGELVGYEAWTLTWTDFTDIGQFIDNLAASTPFDYYEVHGWNANHTDIVHGIGFGYPRIGYQRPDLRFVEGENILEAVPITEPADAYVSGVVVKGAGEGTTQVYAWVEVAVWDRLRRVAVLTDEQVTTTAIGQGLAYQEISTRLAMQGVDTIVVDAFHPHASLGMYAEGDDILIEADLPWFGRVALWHRITELAFTPENGLITLAVQRSEAFRYGRPRALT